MLHEHQFVGFVLVSDATRAKSFYCDVLGLPLVHEDGASFDSFYAAAGSGAVPRTLVRYISRRWPP